MKDIIINQPHLQSFQQKCGSWFLSVLSWVLWLYFLWPLFTLGGWLLGVKNLSDEIRWFGGYKTLLEMLEMYGQIVVVIALLWLLWTLFLSWLRLRVRAKNALPVSEEQLCDAFKVDLAQLQAAKHSQIVTVYFDENALITSIQGEDA
jgi:poly-beta-1,6-N-acetyl-D-glucosamine biosynthesis protein PgaD